MTTAPFTPAELTAAAMALGGAVSRSEHELLGNRELATAVMSAVAPLIAARVRAEVVEGIAADFDRRYALCLGRDMQADAHAHRHAAAIARAHRVEVPR